MTTVCATRKSGNFGGQKGFVAHIVAAKSIGGTSITIVASTVIGTIAKHVKNILVI